MAIELTDQEKADIIAKITRLTELKTKAEATYEKLLSSHLQSGQHGAGMFSTKQLDDIVKEINRLEGEIATLERLKLGKGRVETGRFIADV